MVCFDNMQENMDIPKWKKNVCFFFFFYEIVHRKFNVEKIKLITFYSYGMGNLDDLF